MKSKYAVRNLALCTKDCLCLYVCPTGASDTEDSIIDVCKCIGCGACAMSCPSKAISMVPINYPPQQKKEDKLVNLQLKLGENKALEEAIANTKIKNVKTDEEYRLFKALNMSLRLTNEDLMRESSYMLPQSNKTHELLELLLTKKLPKDILEVVKELLEILPNNDKGY